MTNPTAPSAAPVPDTSQPLDGCGQPAGDDGGRVSTEVLQGFLALVRPHERRATIGVLIVALLVAACCWYFGADAWHSILIGIALTTVGVSGLVSIAGLDLGYVVWRGGGRPNRDGARSDIAELSWSLRGNHGRVDRGAVWRVQRLAQQRLALHRLDLLDPADRPKIEQLIGRNAYAVLVRRKRHPLLRSLLHCLDMLDTLDPARPATPSRSRRRTPLFALHRPRRARER